jgi:hypothetical protein
MMEGMNETDLGHAVSALIMNALSRQMHTAMPGRVDKVSVVNGARVVDVQPLLRSVVDGEQINFSIAPGVLLLTIGTSRSSVLMPVQVGDLVLLIYSERALEFWKQNTEIADTVYGRQFDLSDAFAIPFNFGGLDTAYNNEDVIVKHENQKITIKKNGDIEVGGSSLKKLINEEFAAVFNNHTHNYVGFVGTGTPTPYVTSSPAKLVGTTPVHVQTVPPAPPATNLFADDVGSTHMTTVVKAQ